MAGSALLCRFAQNSNNFSRLLASRTTLIYNRNSLIGATKTANFFTAARGAPTVNSRSLIKSTNIATQRCAGEISAELRSSRAAPLFQLQQRRAASTTGDHVKLWQVERIVSAVFIGLLPACVLLENPVVDGLFATLVVMHAHWGLEAVIVDYARPSVVGPILPKVAFATLYFLSVATLAGLLLLVYNGPGIGTTIRNFWAISEKKTPKSS